MDRDLEEIRKNLEKKPFPAIDGVAIIVMIVIIALVALVAIKAFTS